MLKLSRDDCRKLELKDAYSVHRIVYSLFPKYDDSGTRDFLFADKGGDFNYRKILILSHRKPLTPENGQIESKEIPESFLDFDYYGFEITLNPVTRNGINQTTIPVMGEENLKKWFINKTPALGFAVEAEHLQICRMGVVNFNKNKEEKKFLHTHNTATFIGRLRVTDRSLFTKSFKEGIGRAKGFGFGLLQIIPIQQ
jgi:CRISPR system Cascade subunit CasE